MTGSRATPTKEPIRCLGPSYCWIRSSGVCAACGLVVVPKEAK